MSLRKIVKNTIIGLSLGTIIACNSCKPEPVEPTIKENITAQFELVNKDYNTLNTKLRPGTKAYAALLTDTTWAEINNELKATFLNLDTDKTYNIGVKPSGGYEGTKNDVQAKGGTTAPRNDIIGKDYTTWINIDFKQSDNNEPVTNVTGHIIPVNALKNAENIQAIEKLKSIYIFNTINSSSIKLPINGNDIEKNEYHEQKETALDIKAQAPGKTEQTFFRYIPTTNGEETTLETIMFNPTPEEVYLHSFNTEFLSSKAGKNIDVNDPNIKAAYRYGGELHLFDATTGTITFSDPNQTIPINIELSDIAGHENKEELINHTGTQQKSYKDYLKNNLKNGETYPLTVTAINYTSNITFSANDSEDESPITNATFTYSFNGGEEETTETGTVTNLIRETDGFNKDNITNTINVNTAAEGYNTINGSEQVIITGNNDFNVNLTKIVNNYNFTGTGTGNQNGAIVNVWENGESVGTGTVTNGNYTANWSNTTNPTFEADSIDCTLEGYVRGWVGQTTFEDGIPQNINFELVEEQQSNTYNIIIETLDDKLENYITSGTIKIITQSDQETKEFTIDNDGITDIQIIGNYQPNEQIDMEIYNNTTHTNGTFALLQNGQSAITGKIGSKINLQGYINHNLNTTLDAIDDPTGIYATMLSDESTNNTEIMESLNDPYTNRGIATWTPKNDQEQLISTITFYNKTIDELGNPITQERINRQQEALEFYNSRNITGAGKTLYNTTNAEGISPTDSRAHVIMKLNNSTGAGNGRWYISGETNLFQGVSAHTKDTDTHAKDIDEIGEGLGINDLSSGNNTFAFTYSGPGQISEFSDEGKTVWNTVWTYQPADFKK